MARGMTVDSGAADSVMPRRMLRRKHRVRSSEASRSGVYYVTACNGKIMNEGEVDFPFQTKEGGKHSWTFQVADVNKVLASVSALVDDGYRVTFDKCDRTGVDLSFIVNKKTGESIRMKRVRNVWTVDTYVEPDDEGDSDGGFARQE